MTPISHALLPLVAAYRWMPRAAAPAPEDGACGRPPPSARASWIVAAFGVLPDALDPHLPLADRQASWSHTLAAAGGVALGLALISAFFPRVLLRPVAAWAAGAYLLHLLADAWSGGAAILAPLSPRIVGGSWLSPVWWIVCDGLLLLWLYFAYRWWPRWRGRRGEWGGSGF